MEYLQLNHNINFLTKLYYAIFLGQGLGFVDMDIRYSAVKNK